MNESPSVIILTRTFFGHADILKRNLISTTNVFLNRNKYKFGVILDDESEKDHELGNTLLANESADIVCYEPLPENHREFFQALAYPTMPWGYDRQQWSTFYMDTYVNQDVIGIVDSDSTFTSYLTDENIFTKDGKIKVLGVKPLATWKHWVPGFWWYVFVDGSQYINDDEALKFKTTYDLMCTNIMPMFFWRSSFLNFRKYISDAWNMSFDEAYKIFSRKPYCQFNILANYVMKYESDKYEFIDLKESPTNKVCVAQNGCPTSRDTLCGLIRSFNLSEEHAKTLIANASSSAFGSVPLDLTHSERMADTRHTNNFSYFAKNPCTQEEIDAHYNNVSRDINALSETHKADLDKKLLHFIQNEFNTIVIRG